MEIVFYGAGKWGRDALERYLAVNRAKQNRDCTESEKKLCDDLILKGFADNAKKGSYCGYPMIPVSELREKNLCVVITMKNLMAVSEVYNELKANGINRIYWFLNRGHKESSRDFLLDECIDCRIWGECVLPKVEMHIVDYCNLNCKGCTHFSPIFEKNFPDFEARIRDVKLLKEKISHIMIFSILGGEPFLNPQIDLYMTEIRSILPKTYIQIVTNGLLIPQLDSKILNCIKKNDIVVQISEYYPTHKMIDRIEKKLKEYHIEYYIQPYDKKQKFMRPLSLTNQSRYAHKCISDKCVNIWNGKIARCPTLMFIDQFNKTFDKKLPNEGILRLSDCPEGVELLDILQKEIPLCRHCISCEKEWEQCDRNFDVTDFAVFD